MAFLRGEALFKEVLKTFADSGREPLARYREAVASGDAAGARAWLHRIAPTLAIFGSAELKALLTEVHPMWREHVDTADPALRAERSLLLADGVDALLAQAKVETTG